MSGFLRYVAIGDSQTEGMNDGDAHLGYRGWADRFAEQLALHNPGLQYANLAIRGRRTPAVLSEQLAPALALQPDLASVMAGANDTLGGGFDPEAIAADLEAMYAALTGIGATVIGCTYPDIGKTFSFAGYLSPRVRRLNAHIRAAAARHGVLLVECDLYPACSDPQLWSHDRLHLNPLGHARLAAAFANRMGLTDDVSWQLPLPPALRPPAWRRTVADAEWVARFFVPWAHRHLTGRSTGDGRTAKRPTLLPVEPSYEQEQRDSLDAGTV